MIRVSVTVVKSRSPTPAPDPIILLSGGPGSTSEGVIETLHRFDSWLAKRDLILFDQRGVGWSQPALDCPELRDIELQLALGADLSLEAQLAPRLVCRDRWLNQGIDLTAYNTVETAADVADLWQTLGYDRVNLYGVSYGTLPAQLLMRDCGATGVIRSAILDSPLPLAAPVTAQVSANVAHSMKQLFVECTADLFCRAAYPDLETVYLQVIDRLNGSPVTLSATNPLDGKPYTFQFGVTDFGGLMVSAPYRELPGIIYDIYDGNYTAAIQGREPVIRIMDEAGGNSFGLRTSIMCSEYAFTVSSEQRAAAAVHPEAAFAGEIHKDVAIPLCEQWPTFALDPVDQAPVVSDIPTLILLGEYDRRFPSAYGEMIAESQSRGYYFYVPGAPHGLLSYQAPCPDLLTLSFLDDPTYPPESGCLAYTGRPRFNTQFVIRAAAARLPVQGILGLMSALVAGLIAWASINIHRRRLAGMRLGFAWRHSLTVVRWPLLIASAATIWLVLKAGQANLVPVKPVDAIAMTLPLIVAVQAAFAFSPEDEPALEVMLATSRPPTWTLLERLAVLFTLQGLVATATSLYLAYVLSEPLGVTVIRWLPLVFFLSGVSVYVTLATRRALFGTLVVCLLWVALTVFGDFIVARWPIAWPFHLYLQPGQAEYVLNRLFVTLLGVSLIAVAAARLTSAPERLLLGTQRARQRPKVDATRTTREIGVELADAGSRPLLTLLIQLGAIIRYEFLLHWRRIALPILSVGLIITPVLGALVTQSTFRGYRAALAGGTLTLDVAKAEITAEMMPFIWLGVTFVSIVMVPLVVAETIPRDRQMGVRELLDVQPLSPSVYLTGKLLGLWLSLIAGLSLAALITGIVWRLVVGPFRIDLYLGFWFMGATSLVLLNGSLSMLLAAGQPTNRRAILVGGAFVLLYLAGLGLVLSPAHGVGWLRLLNPARPAVMLHYLLGYPDALQGNDEITRAIRAFVHRVASREDVLQEIGAGLVQVGLVWLVVWQRLKRRKM